MSLILNYEFYNKAISPLHLKKVVITGGPGTGKSSLIKHLERKGFKCYNEISREITLKARAHGIEQLFLTQPLLFSEKLLEGRIAQYNKTLNEKESVVFLDRGIPDILAYMDYINDDYPMAFSNACENYIYDYVFILAPWQDIFTSDNERYESFDQATEIHHHLMKTYKKFGYELVDVPFETVENRSDFVLETLNLY